MQSSRKVTSAPSSTRPQDLFKDKRTTTTPASNGPKKTTPPTPSRSTTKKKVQPPAQDLEFLVTGKQIFRRNNRAHSLPGSSRRPSLESLRISTTSSPRKTPSRDLTLDDVSLDLSQDSLDCIKNQKTFTTSTPKFHHQDSLKIHRSTSRSQASSQNAAEGSRRTKPAEDALNTSTKRSNYSKKHRISSRSLKISQEITQKTEKNVQDCFISEQIKHSLGNSSFEISHNDVEDNRRVRKNVEDDLMNESMFSCSIEDSVYQTSSNASQISRYSQNRLYNTSRSTDLDFSSASPEDSGQSSDGSTAGLVPASSHHSHKQIDIDGEWHDFWTTYNSPRRPSCDQCLTDFITETHQTDILTEISKPITDLNGIKPEGIFLTRSEAENIIECAHTIGNVLSKAMERTEMKCWKKGNEN